MDPFGRFYTEDIISNLLVQEIDCSNPKLIIDLGIGRGSLTKAAFHRWGDATFLASDIDITQINITKKKFPFVKIIEADGLELSLGKKLNIVVDSVDIAICNPPYLRIPAKENRYNELFEKTNLPNCKKLKYLTSDLIFLAQNILLLKDGGILGIILPDGLLSNMEFMHLRQDLIDNHTLISIIQLPDKIFRNTEARTHIMVLRKGVTNRKSTVNLFLADKKGILSEYLALESILLIKRMDYFFHKLCSKSQPYCQVKNTLKDIGAEIKRGQLTHKDLKGLKSNYIHTTFLTHKSELILKNDIDETQQSIVHTEENDILLARVGKGCIGKVSKVLKGQQLISDCVYKIRVPKKYLNQTWLSLCSESGQLWLKSNAHGVCSRVISKCDLQNFPVLITEDIIQDID